MKPAEFAAILNGATYCNVISCEQSALAKRHGLVVVYGQSDDLMEFAGAIDDEAGMCDGGTAYVDSQGIIPDFESIDRDDKDELRKYFKREGGGRAIEAVWCEPGRECSWTYKTNIPHATFDVMEDDELYCVGIMFSLADAMLAGASQKESA